MPREVLVALAAASLAGTIQSAPADLWPWACIAALPAPIAARQCVALLVACAAMLTSPSPASVAAALAVGGAMSP